MFSLLLGLAISMAVAVLGYSRARAFVSERLRYVDAVNHPLAPLMAGAGAFALGALVAAFLPIVGVGTALTFGLAVGLGVSAGRGDVPRFPRTGRNWASGNSRTSCATRRMLLVPIRGARPSSLTTS